MLARREVFAKHHDSNYNHNEREEFDAVRAEAQRRGVSLSELVRQSLHDVGAIGTEAPWMKFAGMVESGDPGSSQHIDQTVYGEE